MSSGDRHNTHNSSLCVCCQHCLYIPVMGLFYVNFFCLKPLFKCRKNNCEAYHCRLTDSYMLLDEGRGHRTVFLLPILTRVSTRGCLSVVPTSEFWITCLTEVRLCLCDRRKVKEGTKVEARSSEILQNSKFKIQNTPRYGTALQTPLCVPICVGHVHPGPHAFYLPTLNRPM